MSDDLSRLFYKRYFTKENLEVKIFLKDDTILVGVIAAVFHGDISEGEPFVVIWHVISKLDLEKFNSADEQQHLGTFVKQEDIEAMRPFN